MPKRSLGLCLFLVSQAAAAQPAPATKPAPAPKPAPAQDRLPKTPEKSVAAVPDEDCAASVKQQAFAQAASCPELPTASGLEWQM